MTTTTLMVLVAMACAGPAASGAETRAGLAETGSVRAMAAVVAAVARDLISLQRPAATADVLPTVDLVPVSATLHAGQPADEAPSPLDRLAERLLDLPPPVA